MVKKYIIEIPDDQVNEFVGSTHLLMPYSMAGHKGHHDTGLSLTPYAEPDLEQVRIESYAQGQKDLRESCMPQMEEAYDCGHDEGYKLGLADAWEAARKVCCSVMAGGLNYSTLNAIFGSRYPESIIAKYTATDAIELLKAYEQDEKINVGDEVELDDGKTAIWMGNTGSGYVYILYSDGSCGCHPGSIIVRKTGRHFPEIAAVLEKMKEG